MIEIIVLCRQLSHYCGLHTSFGDYSVHLLAASGGWKAWLPYNEFKEWNSIVPCYPVAPHHCVECMDIFTINIQFSSVKSSPSKWYITQPDMYADMHHFISWKREWVRFTMIAFRGMTHNLVHNVAFIQSLILNHGRLRLVYDRYKTDIIRSLNLTACSC